MNKCQQVVEFFYPGIFLAIGILEVLQVRRNGGEPDTVGVIQVGIGKQVVFQEKIE